MLFKINTLRQETNWQQAEESIISMLGAWKYPISEASIIEIKIPSAVAEGLFSRASRKRVLNTLEKLGAAINSDIVYIAYTNEESAVKLTA